MLDNWVVASRVMMVLCNFFVFEPSAIPWLAFGRFSRSSGVMMGGDVRKLVQQVFRVSRTSKDGFFAAMGAQTNLGKMARNLVTRSVV